MTAPDASRFTLRPATSEDAEDIATVWHRGWIDGHLGHVPEALHAHRRLSDFRERVPPRLPTTTVATLDSRVVGFVTVHEDEVEQLYVAESARGSGLAAELLRHGEKVIAARHPLAWLAVAVGNARARRFYARQGWVDAGHLDYGAETSSGPILRSLPAVREAPVLSA
jgi:ribosomal protein S18 acetylase RimI-like enzyme